MQRWYLVCLALICTLPATAGEWSEMEIRLLPDSSFAAVETDAHGRKHRHCPFRDAGGQIDADQLIFALGRLDREKWLDPASAAAARKRLERYYQRWRAHLDDTRLPPAVDLNSAAPCQLVRLPGIGPVLAVRIVDYRTRRAAFLTPEDVMKVEGISRSTFLAIRHYIEIH